MYSLHRAFLDAVLPPDFDDTDRVRLATALTIIGEIEARSRNPVQTEP